MAFIHHQQKIFGKIIQQAEGTFTRGSSIKITGIVFDPGTMAQFPNHLQVKSDSFIQTLGFIGFANLLQIVDLCTQINIDLTDCLIDPFLRRHKQVGRVDIQFILFIHFLTSLRIKRGDTIYLVIPKFNPISQPIKCFDSGENIYRITIHPETSTVEFKLVVNIQSFYKAMQQLVPIYMHSLFQMSHLG